MKPRRMIYGRRQAPRLKPNHKRLLDELLPRLRITLPDTTQPLTLRAMSLPENRPLWLEIGFGGGEHLAATALANPDVTIAGVEPYVTGVAKLLSEIEARNLSNVRILVDDARLLLKSLPDASLERVFILYADPWPKVRHHKRRIINDETMADLARVLKPGAELRIATDHLSYRHWILGVMRRAGPFEWLARCKADWERRPSDQMPTRYEEKAKRAGREPVYLLYCRRI